MILVWREDEMFHARRADRPAEEQICLGVDLFEVIAELAGLELEDRDQSREAVGLAGEAHRRLANGIDPWTAPDRGPGSA
jgi:hypothetical protein